MYSNKTIQKLAAGIMLLLFALSITPKQLLHDKITGHTHSYVKYDTDAGIGVSKNSFQCNWHNQEAQSPFSGEPDFQLEHPVIIHSSNFNYYTLHNYSAERFLTSLRGPPQQA